MSNLMARVSRGLSGGPSAKNLAAGVGLLLLTGCASLSESQKASIRDAAEAYNRGDAAGAAGRLNRVISQSPDGMQIAEAYYIRGLCRVQAGQLQEAASDFDAAIARSRREDLTALSQASLGSIWYRSGDWNRAADLYTMALARLPDQPPTDQVALSAGIALQRAGRWRDASLQFGRIIRHFPNGTVTPRARQLAAWPFDHFAIQIGVFSRSDTAMQQVQAAKAKGIDAYLQSMTRDGKVIWVILTGRFSTYNEALNALQRIRQFEGQAFVLP